MAAADPPLNKTPPSLAEARDAMKCRGGKADTISNICARALNAGGKAMIHAVFFFFFLLCGSLVPFLFERKRELLVPVRKGKGDRQDFNNCRGITGLSLLGKVLFYLLLIQISFYMLKFHIR